MRRRLLILVVFLLAGAIVNVAVAWGCVAVVEPAAKPNRFIAERVDSPAIRDFWLVHEAVGLGVTYVTYTRTDAIAWHRGQIRVEEDLPNHPSWAPWPPDPRPSVRETTWHLAAGLPFRCAVALLTVASSGLSSCSANRMLTDCVRFLIRPMSACVTATRTVPVERSATKPIRSP